MAGPRPCTLRELIEQVRQATGQPRGSGCGCRWRRCWPRPRWSRTCCQALHARSADLPAADGLLHQRLGVRHVARPAGARLGAPGGAGRGRSADGRRLPAALGRRLGESRSRIEAYWGSTASRPSPGSCSSSAARSRSARPWTPCSGHLPPVQGRLCLELGCGTGLTSHFLRAAGRHLGERGLRARPRPLGAAAGAAIGCCRSASGSCRSRPRPSTWWPRSTSSSTSRTTRPSSPRWCGCSSRAATSCSWRPRASTAGPASPSSGCSASRPTRRASATRATATRTRPRPARSWSGTASGVQGQETYCRFFTESLEDLLNYAYHRKAMQGKDDRRSRTFTATPRRCRPTP